MSDLLKTIVKSETMLSKTNVKIAPGAIVCLECELKGDITIGRGTVIHARSRIIAEAGPIIIGEFNLIEELAEIINAQSENDAPDSNQTVMIIGNNNVFEVDSYCAALQVGDNNIIESKAYVGRQAELSSGCVIGSLCCMLESERLAENTVIYGHHNSRRTQHDKPAPQIQQLDFLAKILPNYHHVRKPTKI